MLQRAVVKWTPDVVQAVHDIETLVQCLRYMPRCARHQCELSDLCGVYED